MTAEIKRLGVATFKQRVSEDTVALLKTLLGRAEKGEICGMVVVADKADGGTMTDMTGMEDAVRTIGLIEAMKYDFLEQWSASYRKEPR